MTIYSFIKILWRKALILIALPVVTGIIVYLATNSLPVQYSTEATIFTGITSNSGIDNMGSSKVDYFATQNAYNNLISVLKSRNVMEETALRLFSAHLLLESPDEKVISEKSFEELQDVVPSDIMQLKVKNDFERSYQNITSHIDQKNDNFLYGILNYDHPDYSTKALSNIKVERIQNSDMIKIVYTNSDPGICYQTVKILTSVFIKRYNLLKKNQTGTAVAYFEKQLRESSAKLKSSEDRLLSFNTQNDIINYYEQTKHISSQEEKIEIKLQEMSMQYSAAQAVLNKLEIETKKRFDINLQNVEILAIREKLISLNDQLARTDLSQGGDDNEEILKLNNKKIKLEKKLANKIDSLYTYKSNSQGIELEKILGDWLDAVKEFESARARFTAMKERKKEFEKMYQQYAPLGAKLKRIEREIYVNEEEYLEILHHLGLARLKQQNAEMMSDMKILDEPSFPINALPTKRKMYVMVASIFSVILFVLGLFLYELLDKRIKTPARLEESANKKVITAFSNQKSNDQVHNNKTAEKSLKYLQECIFKTEDEQQTGNPFIIQIFSHWNEEGKSFIAEQLLNQLLKEGKKCTLINNSTKLADGENIINNSQTPAKEYSYKRILNDMLPDKYANLDYIIVEHDSVSEGLSHPALLKEAHLDFLVVDANRVWSKADSFYLEKINNVDDRELYMVLNKANPDDLEEIMGDVPKKRSSVRKFLKKKILRRFLNV
jgi:uncharacterized protein involved in exopolysaccharide biosynthesis